MKILTLITFVLLANLGSLNGCSDHDETRRLHQFRSQIMSGMKMNNEQLERISPEAIEEARQLLPILETHPHLEHTKIHVIEDETPMTPSQHLFNLPDSISSHDLLKSFLTFYIRPLQPKTRLTIEVKARELSSDTIYHVATEEIDSPQWMKKMRMKLDDQLVMRWLDLPVRSIILSIECREIDSDLIVLKDDVDSTGKSMILELDVTVTTKRKRRSFEDQQKCATKKDSKEILPNQECCMASKIISLRSAELNLPNIISPTIIEINWCAGECNMESSFKPLFSYFTSKIHDQGGNGPRCCHASESSSVDFLFLDENGTVKNVRMDGIVATECACA